MSPKGSKKTPPDISAFPRFDLDWVPETDFDFASGSVFLIDKPKKWSSFRPVGLIRKLTGIKKVGHAGTLDPMATGLLIICTGKATKSIQQIQDAPKTYHATVTFGASTPSFDAETEPDLTSSFSHLTADVIREKLSSEFTGEISQLPPMYSAVWHKGERLYKLARKGMEVERAERHVTVYEIDLNQYDPETGIAEIMVKCSKGTYIRSIAHDLGLALNTHAHLSGLRRTQIGDYSADRALTVQQLVTYFQADGEIDLS